MPNDRNRKGTLAVIASALLLIVIVVSAALLGAPTGWVIFIALAGVPLVLAPAALLGLRWGDARMAKAGPGVLIALGPGEIHEVPAGQDSAAALGWRAAWKHLPALLPRRRIVTVSVVALLGAAGGAGLTLALAGTPELWRLALCTALFALCGALGASVLPFLIWFARTHSDNKLPRDTRRMIENSINPANDRLRINLSRVDELDRAIAQRRIVFPLLVPIALCLSGAIAVACAAQLVLTDGQDFPSLASSTVTSLMILVPLTSLGVTEQLASALEDVRVSDETD